MKICSIKVLVLWCSIALGLSAPTHAQEVASPIAIGESGRGWGYNSGSEFPGAKGSLNHRIEGGETINVLTFDLGEGGRYVAAVTGADVPLGYTELRLQARSDTARKLVVRLRDDSGQYHQVSLPYNDAGKWQTLRIDLASFRSVEHWGGKNDGRLYFPITQIWICAGHPNDPSGVMEFKNVKAER